MKELKKAIYFLLPLLLLTTCNGVREAGKTDATVIEYSVEYLDKMAGSIRTDILPKKMRLILTNRYAMNSIRGFFGQFSLTYVANLNKGKVTTLLKFFDKKFYYQGKKGELPCGIDPMRGLLIVPTGGYIEILSFRCNEYEITEQNGRSFMIYSSDEIVSSSPNMNTPYYEIDEVLLQFYTKLDVLKMNLVAESIIEEPVDRDIFTIPEGYKEVSREEMEKTISLLFN